GAARGELVEQLEPVELAFPVDARQRLETRNERERRPAGLHGGDRGAGKRRDALVDVRQHRLNRGLETWEVGGAHEEPAAARGGRLEDIELAVPAGPDSDGVRLDVAAAGELGRLRVVEDPARDVIEEIHVAGGPRSRPVVLPHTGARDEPPRATGDRRGGKWDAVL